MNIETAVRADKAEVQRLAREEAYSTPLKDFHPGAPRLFQNDTLWPWFERLRKEEPVHYCTNAPFGPTGRSPNTRTSCMSTPTTASSLPTPPSAASRSATCRRATTGRASSRWTRRAMPSSARWSPDLHADQPGRTRDPDPRAHLQVLDGLPRNETFDWVDRVSIELDHAMLATLFDFPFAERRKLTYWSDVATADVPPAGSSSPRRSGWRSDRVRWPIFTSAVARAGERRRRRPDLDDGAWRRDADLLDRPMEFLGNLVLLIVGGNDTTRNSISGGLWALTRTSRRVPQAAREPGADPRHGAGDHPLADRRHPHAPHRDGRYRDRRQADPRRRQGGDVVRLRQPRRRMDREAGRASSSTAPGRASTCRSASASTAASAPGWPSCS